jgi:hypothetical protein
MIGAESMLAVLAIVAPVFALMGLGYLTARSRYLPETAGAALSQFAFKIAIPAMLFRAMLTAAPMQASPWRLLAAYFLAAAACWLAAVLAAALVLRRPAEDHAALAMGATFGNTVMLGIPIGVMAFGPEATTLLAMLVAVEAPLLWIAGTLHMELARSGRRMSLAGLRDVGRDLATNPVILALLLGLAGRAAGLQLPEIPDRMLALLGQAGVPTALFALGMVLSTFRLGGEGGALVLIAGLKLFALPLLVYLATTYLFGLPPLVAAVAVLHAAMPVGANAFLFASRYERSASTISAGIVASTLVAVATTSALLLLLAGNR